MRPLLVWKSVSASIELHRSCNTSALASGRPHAPGRRSLCAWPVEAKPARTSTGKARSSATTPTRRESQRNWWCDACQLSCSCGSLAKIDVAAAASSER